MSIYLDFATGINLPPFWLDRPVQVWGTHEMTANGVDDRIMRRYNQDEYLGNLYQAPIEIKWKDEQNWWTLPFDPVVSIQCKNIMVRRNVLKKEDKASERRGSIKEGWSQDDYEINIAGVFIGSDERLPENELTKFRRYCETRKLLQVKCELFRIFNITQMVIEDYSLPFTKGIENQMYSIKGYSDDAFELLVKEER